jgi:hypothetical protein
MKTDKGGLSRPVSRQVPLETLKTDLDVFKEKTLKLGASMAEIISARLVTEGMGIDVYGLATKVGWDIYPIYRTVDPQAVPSALAVGIAFIC